MLSVRCTLAVALCVFSAPVSTQGKSNNNELDVDAEIVQFIHDAEVELVEALNEARNVEVHVVDRSTRANHQIKCMHWTYDQGIECRAEDRYCQTSRHRADDYCTEKYCCETFSEIIESKCDAWAHAKGIDCNMNSQDCYIYTDGYPGRYECTVQRCCDGPPPVRPKKCGQWAQKENVHCDIDHEQLCHEHGEMGYDQCSEETCCYEEPDDPVIWCDEWVEDNDHHCEPRDEECITEHPEDDHPVRHGPSGNPQNNVIIADHVQVVQNNYDRVSELDVYGYDNYNSNTGGPGNGYTGPPFQYADRRRDAGGRTRRWEDEELKKCSKKHCCLPPPEVIKCKHWADEANVHCDIKKRQECSVKSAHHRYNYHHDGPEECSKHVCCKHPEPEPEPEPVIKKCKHWVDKNNVDCAPKSDRKCTFEGYAEEYPMCSKKQCCQRKKPRPPHHEPHPPHPEPTNLPEHEHAMKCREQVSAHECTRSGKSWLPDLACCRYSVQCGGLLPKCLPSTCCY